MATLNHYTYLVDGCLHAGAKGAEEPQARRKIEQYWPRSTIEYVGVNLYDEPRKLPEPAPLRPVSHHLSSTPSRIPGEKRPFKARRKEFTGGHADEATLREMEDSIVEALAKH